MIVYGKIVFLEGEKKSLEEEMRTCVRKDSDLLYVHKEIYRTGSGWIAGFDSLYVFSLQ